MPPPSVPESSAVDNFSSFVGPKKLLRSRGAAAGGASGQVNLGGGVLGYLKVQVGATAFGIPMYGINP